MQAPLLAFAARLPDELADDFVQLLLEFDSHNLGLQLDREDIVWRTVTAHLPGLAPTLEILRAHLQETTQPACAVTAEWCDQAGKVHSRTFCRIAHESGYDSFPTPAPDPAEARGKATSSRDGASRDRTTRDQN